MFLQTVPVTSADYLRVICPHFTRSTSAVYWRPCCAPAIKWYD